MISHSVRPAREDSAAINNLYTLDTKKLVQELSRRKKTEFLAYFCEKIALESNILAYEKTSIDAGYDCCYAWHWRRYDRQD